MGNIESTYMLATLCAVVVNVVQSALGGKDKRRAITASDFIPDWGGESAEKSAGKQSSAQTVDEMKALFKELARSSKVKTKKRPAKAPLEKRGPK